MTKSILTYFVGIFALLNGHTAFAQQITPSAELDIQPYLSSCQNEDQEAQEACSQKSLMAYIGEHLSYPKEAYKDKIEGMVVLEFIVGRNGKIKEGKILRSSNHTLLDNAALALIDSMKEQQQWQPGTKDGKAVNTALKLPVKFKLK